MIESFQVGTDLFLVSQTLSPTIQAKPVVVPTHHIIWVDCSGSMYGELPKLRQQLKNKLVSLVSDGDLVTVGWFSSRGQFGILFEALPIKTVRDLSDMHRAIDRYLQTMGATGFKQPIEETLNIIKRNPNTHAISFFFQTDGYENQWSKKEVLDAVRSIAPVVSSATFVEYGYYANKQLLAEMAENIGGSLIFCEDFRAYEPAFEAAMQKRPMGGKKVTVQLEGNVLHGVAFALIEREIGQSATDGRAVLAIGNDVVTFAPNEQNAIMVPEGTAAVHYLARHAVGPAKTWKTAVDIDDGQHTALYAALYLMSQRMKSNEVYALLQATGDVRLIRQATNAYGKQALNQFQNAILATVSNAALRLSEGYDPTLVPAEDAYTVLDLLNDLVADDKAKFYPNHPSFVYKRTGRKGVAKTTLTEAQEKDIALFEEKKANARSEKESDIIQTLIDTILEGGAAPLKFTYANENAGYPLNKIVFSEDRPNASVQVRIEGSVDVTALVAANPALAGIPNPFPSFIYRNFTLVKDGIVNVDMMPVSMSETTFKKLRDTGVLGHQQHWWSDDMIFDINLRAIPVINRKMVKSVSAKRLFELDYARTKLGAAQKVFKFYEEQHFGKRASEGFKTLYSEAAATALKEAGLSDYSGFNPKRVLAEAMDKYSAVELLVKIKGLSSLPKITDVEKAIDAKKTLTISQRIVAEAINEYRSFIKSTAYTKFPKDQQDDLLRMWLSTKAKDAIDETRKLIRELAEIKFGIVLGQTWFTEFSSIEENTLVMKLDGEDVSCVVELKDIEVEI